MKRLFFLLLLWPCVSTANNSPVLKKSHTLSLPTIVRAYYDNKQQLQDMSEFADIWQINSKQNYALIQIKDPDTLNQIHDLNVSMRIDHNRVKERNESLKKIMSSIKNDRSIPGFTCYSTVEETFQRMNNMVTNHPNLAEIVDIGDSWEKINLTNQGHDIRVIKITNQSITGDKPILFLSSAIHAREYATAELNTRFGEFLLNQYGIDADVTWILDNHEIHLLLQTNPDGRKQAEAGDLWRKNTNQDHCGVSSMSRGVDLNRNYPFEWGVGSSSTDGCSDIFRGPNEGSEPEVTFQMDYLSQIYADNRGADPSDAAPENTPGIFVDIHSFSQLVLWPWGYTTDPAANDNQLQALGKRTALFNQYRPLPVNNLVTTGGGSIDWSYGELGVASLAFELGTSFFQDCDTFENEILPDNLEALLYLARVTQAPYIQPLGPDIELMNITPNVITAGQTIHISGTANDDRYNQTETAQPFETVQTVVTTINEIPMVATSSQTLAATDGTFNEVNEAFTGSINTSAMNLGKNLVYVQATDSNNKTGATYAEFVEVVNLNEVAQLNGQITDISNGLSISQALIEINQSKSFSNTTGQYNQLVQPGSADLVVSAEGFVTQTINGLTLTMGDSFTQDVQLQPFCNIFEDDTENGFGDWSPQNPWSIDDGQSVSPQNSWTDSPDSDYENNLNAALESPTIHVNLADSLEIQYMSLCDTEAGFDFGHFEIQFDGGNWQELSQCNGSTNWVQVNQTIIKPTNANQMKFRFRLTSDTAVTSGGWSIDDVTVKASGAVCGFINPDIIFTDDFE